MNALMHNLEVKLYGPETGEDRHWFSNDISNCERKGVITQISQQERDIFNHEPIEEVQKLIRAKLSILHTQKAA